MRAGSLRNRIAIQQANVVANSLGEQVKTWILFATVWAMAEPFRGKEVYQSDQVLAQQVITFTVRSRAGITEKMRIYWDRRYYNIVAVGNVRGIRHEMKIHAIETTEAAAS